MLGKLYLARGELLTAQEAGLKSLARDEEATQASKIAGRLFQAAEECLRKADQLKADDPAILVDLGRSLEHLGRDNEALEAFLRAVRLDAATGSAALRIALHLDDRARRSNNHEELLRAIRYYRLAEQSNEMSGDMLGRYGLALASVGKWEEAEAMLKRAVAGNESSPLGMRLQEVQAVLERLRGMEEQAQAQLAKDPKDAVGLRLHAQAQVFRGYYLRAGYLLEQLMRLDPSDPRLWVTMGFARAEIGTAEGFLREWPVPPAPPPGQESPWLQLARMCASAGGWDDAQFYLEKGVGHYDPLLRPMFALGELAVALHQPRRAQGFFRKAAEASPKDPEPWLRLCDLALETGDAAAVKSALDEAEKRGAKPEELSRRKARTGSATAGTASSQ
jgi:tetratricopeptide (TPR) repeat protein